MLAEAGGADLEKGTAPEIAIIKEILLSDLKRAHEARLERLEERLSALSRDVDSKLTELATRIEAVATGSGQSQKQALIEIGNAITQIALGLKHGETGLGSAGEVPPPKEKALEHVEEASPHGEEALGQVEEAPRHGDEALRHAEEVPSHGGETAARSGVETLHAEEAPMQEEESQEHCGEELKHSEGTADNVSS